MAHYSKNQMNNGVSILIPTYENSVTHVPSRNCYLRYASVCLGCHIHHCGEFRQVIDTQNKFLITLGNPALMSSP